MIRTASLNAELHAKFIQIWFLGSLSSLSPRHLAQKHPSTVSSTQLVQSLHQEHPFIQQSSEVMDGDTGPLWRHQDPLQAFALSSAWPDICCSLIPSKRHWLPSHTTAHTLQALTKLCHPSMGSAWEEHPSTLAGVLGSSAFCSPSPAPPHMAMRAPTPQITFSWLKRTPSCPWRGASSLLSPATAWDLLYLQHLWGEFKLGKSALAFSRRKLWCFPLT